MSAEDIFEKVAEEQGWTPETEIWVLLQYIENQKDNSAFEDFLRRQQEEENADAEQLI